jgi:methionine sulfoxide reductase heme-binding subunit
VNSNIDPGQHLWWLMSRSLGVVALVLISLSVGLGLALAGRLIRTPGAPARIKTLHEALALSGLIAITGHGLALLGDSYLHPGLAGISVPFALGHRTLWTGLGVIAGWLAALITGSFYVRRRIGVRTWRKLHRATFAVYGMGIVHALGSGTDARSTWFLASLGAVAVPALVAGTHRLIMLDRAAQASLSRGTPG